MAESSSTPITAPFTSLAHLLEPSLRAALKDDEGRVFTDPTAVQTAALPLAFQGKDLLVRAPTGSGKTLVYLLPIINNVIKSKQALSYLPQTCALILVPTLELAAQVMAHAQMLLRALAKDTVSIVCLNAEGNKAYSALKRDTPPDIVIATPARALAALQLELLSLDKIVHLAIDEADLILSYGHQEAVNGLLNGNHLPKHYQAFLMSATLTQDVARLKTLVLRNPAIVKVDQSAEEAAKLTHYMVNCNEITKFMLLVVLLKTKWIKGKCVIFVNNVNRGVRLKLLLDKFNVRVCLLNAEMPINSRYHMVQLFNKGMYDYIIATEDSKDEEDDEDSEDEVDESMPQLDNMDEQALQEMQNLLMATQPTFVEEIVREVPQKESIKKPEKKPEEFGVSRGIDFIAVSAVINFDMPQSTRAYIHRVGRTARAGASGIALTFAVPEGEWKKDTHLALSSAKRDQKMLRAIQRDQEDRLKELPIDWSQVDGWRYRIESALKAITKSAIREARLKEIKQELLNSEKLKKHFEENPNDLLYLQQDKAMGGDRSQPEMKHIPSYLQPRMALPRTEQPMNVSFKKDKPSKGKKPYMKNAGKKNPLKTFSTK